MLLEQRAAKISKAAPFAGEPLIAADLASFRHDTSAGALRKRTRLAEALLRIGKTSEAVALYDELLRDAPRHGLSEPDLLERIEYPRALAYLRLGEQENCVAHTTPQACLFPLGPEAVHQHPRGSMSAVEAFLEILRRHPEDLNVKWLLNIAYMSLGMYPDDVPAEWLIPEPAYRGEGEIQPFANTAASRGLATMGLSGGAIVDDFDRDGDLDVMASSSYPIDGPGGQLRYYRNDGAGVFSDATQSAGLEGILGGLNLVHADFDNDGYLDVFILRGAWHLKHGKWPNTLLRNNGNGTFTDVTLEAGLLSFHPTQAAAWGDFNNDGWIDLFVANETGLPYVPKSAGERFGFGLMMLPRRLFEVQGHLYRNNGDGTFDDILPELDIDLFGWAKGVSWGDVDRDGRLDLYISRFAARNLLYRNEGPDSSGHWRFSDVTDAAGVGEPEVSFATWFWDYDNDGWSDLLVAGYPYPEVTPMGRGMPPELSMSSHDEIAEFIGRPSESDASKPRLYRNLGDGSFEDVTKRVGLYRAMSPMGANFGDVDNDGFLDVYFGTGAPPFDFLVPNRLFRNVGGSQFEDVTLSANVGHLQKGHGVAFGDIDGDGDQDIFIVLGGAFPGDSYPNALFENPGNDNNWITLVLEGTTANRAAIGARVELTLGAEAGHDERTIVRTVGGGGSFGGNSLQLEIGLGRADTLRRLRITWPDRESSVEDYSNLEVNHTYRVRQGGEAIRVTRPSPATPSAATASAATASGSRSRAVPLR